jgi:hypothetical protein
MFAFPPARPSLGIRYVLSILPTGFGNPSTASPSPIAVDRIQPVCIDWASGCPANLSVFATVEES